MTVTLNIDRFQIRGELGRGSQGVVFLAFDPRLERQVAIKTIHSRFSGQDDRQKRLLLEARTVSKLQHPNVIPLYEAGEFGGQIYLVFEYVDGMSLSSHLKRNGHFAVHRSIQIIRQVLEGISCAHDRGIVHRDLSPSNILIDRNDIPRIMDFGISVIVGENGHPATDIVGTPCYMSPEHFSHGAICTQSDIFSLGLIFYEMLVGSPAIMADNDFTAMFKIANEPIAPPSLSNTAVDEKLDRIILKALEKDLSRRYHSAAEMIKDLDAYLNDDPAQFNETGSHSTLEFLLRRIRHKSDFPTFSHNIIDINRKASVSNTNYSSASELANAVLKDYSLTSKLLKLVNSAFYGCLAGKITTISRAVVVLGFERVSMAASSLMLFEHLKNKSQEEEMSDAAISSLMSGMIARDIAGKLGVDPEEAFICAMLHNLGKHLVIFYFEEEYNQIRKLMAQKGLSETAASRSVLGIAYEDLGIGIAKAWRFPDKIVSSMRTLPEGIQKEARTEEEMLRNLSGFSNELCLILGSGEEEGNTEALSELMGRFEKTLPLTKKQIAGLLDAAKEKMEDYSTVYNINLTKSRFLRRLNSHSIVRDKGPSDAILGLEPDKETEGPIQMNFKDLEIVHSTHVGPEMRDAESILINGIQDTTNTLLENFELNDVLTMILETMYRGFAFHRVLFCIMNHTSRIMSARFGFGKDIHHVIRQFKFEVKGSLDVFNFAVLHEKDIGIDNASDPRFEKWIPEWFLQSLFAPAFVLYPVTVNKKPVGLFYADRDQIGRVISGNQANYMKTLCNQAVLAIGEMRRRGASYPSVRASGWDGARQSLAGGERFCL